MRTQLQSESPILCTGAGCSAPATSVRVVRAEKPIRYLGFYRQCDACSAKWTRDEAKRPQYGVTVEVRPLRTGRA